MTGETKNHWKSCKQCGRLYEVTAPRQRFCDDKACKGIRAAKSRGKARRKKQRQPRRPNP